MRILPFKLAIDSEIDPLDRDTARWINQKVLQEPKLANINRVAVQEAWKQAPHLSAGRIASLYRLSTKLGAHIPAVWEPETAGAVFGDPPMHRGQPLRRTRIICTAGPACKDARVLAKMIEAGMDVVRLNFSHIRSDADAQGWIDLLQRAMTLAKRKVTIMADLQGPKVRTAELAKPICVTQEGIYDLHAPGGGQGIPLQPASVLDDLRVGDPIHVGDGTPSLMVHAIENGRIKVRAHTTGIIESNKGLNMPKTALSLPVPTDYDGETIARINRLQIDGKPAISVAAISFITNAAQVRAYREAFGRPIKLIAKIERERATDEGVLEEITDAADGTMAARGDYRAEAGLGNVPLMQNDVHFVGNRLKKPTVNATETMTGAQSGGEPDRSNENDVADAIEDGAEAIMTSGETAIPNGQDPARVVQMLNQIILRVERAIKTGAGRRNR